MERTQTPSFFLPESFDTAHFPTTRQNSDAKYNMLDLTGTESSTLLLTTNKPALVLNFDDLLQWKKLTQSTIALQNLAADDKIIEPYEDLFYFFLTLSGMYRICLISNFKTGEIQQILRNQGIYKFTEGVLSSYHKGSESSSFTYVAMNGYLSETEFANAVYINAPKLLFKEYEDRKLNLAPQKEPNRSTMIKNLMAFLVHLHCNPKKDLSISALYKAFETTYGNFPPKNPTENVEKPSIEELENHENILEKESDDSLHLNMRTFESSVIGLKNKIFSTHYYEEVWDFEAVKQETPHDGGESSCFQSRLMRTHCSSRKSLSSLRVRTCSEDSESDIFMRHVD